MVRVLANGEVVPDDDPRARGDAYSRAPKPTTSSRQTNRTAPPAEDGLYNLWNAANGRLYQFGIPAFPIAGYILEPLHIVLAVIALIMFGPLALVVVLAIAVMTQQRGAAEAPDVAPRFNTPSSFSTNSQASSRPTPSAPPMPRSSGSGAFSGSGQRLGSYLLCSTVVVLTTLFLLGRWEFYWIQIIQMLLARGSRIVQLGPSCSWALTASDVRLLRPVIYQSQKNMSSLPPAIAPMFQYASECYMTQGLQLGMEVLHNVGLPWASAIVASGVALRLLTSPIHILAEKLLAKRIHAQNFFTQEILKKLAEKYKVQITPNVAGNQLVLNTNKPHVTEEANKLLSEKVPQFLAEHNLQASRIQNLKICTVPFWIFSSFALRNIISSDFHPSIPGGLWIEDLLVPDPYFILPIAVGVFGFLNMWSQRKIYPVQISSWRSKSYDFLLGGFTLFAVVIMAQLPACIPLYWLVVSMTGMAQTQILRHATIKGWLGIRRLATDSRTPFRDLFLKRRV